MSRAIFILCLILCARNVYAEVFPSYLGVGVEAINNDHSADGGGASTTIHSAVLFSYSKMINPFIELEGSLRVGVGENSASDTAILLANKSVLTHTTSLDQEIRVSTKFSPIQFNPGSWRPFASIGLSSMKTTLKRELYLNEVLQKKTDQSLKSSGAIVGVGVEKVFASLWRAYLEFSDITHSDLDAKSFHVGFKVDF